MRDTAKQLRQAVYQCMAGQIGYPDPTYPEDTILLKFYDEKKLVSVTEKIFALLSTQQETLTDENDCTWITRSSIDIEIYHKTGSEVSKDVIDDLSNAILVRLMPTPQTTNIIDPSNLQFCNHKVDSIISRNISLSETESVLEKIIRFSVQIIQQT